MATDEPDPPKPRLVVENDGAAFRAEWAKRSIQSPLRDLAANLMRITRGAGKPHEVGGQCSAVLEAFTEYRGEVGTWPSSWEIQEALELDRPSTSLSDEALEWETGIRAMMYGSLQIAASQLLGQKPQRVAGERELLEGLRPIEERRARSRQQYLAATSLPERQRRRNSRTKKPSSKP
ncbi:hypothetical protein H9Q09_22180 [Aurantimonas sp. DM33-3]|uniref:hypothetical protein n=1 Tax=Aurantimonas sp. DM33-3 TaxID=2766955 RepID=UPI001651B9FB|nr:hypothetical protein [Aurantimonas sp. DM33-3]MBC6718880.1 hypothetical protein [Aurantimonas sp. DM33-3]